MTESVSAQSAGGGDEGQQVKARRERLGWNRSRFAAEVGINRDTLAGIEAGQGYQAGTMAKILEGLDRLEVEAGVHAAPRSESDLVTFEVSGDGGFRVVVKGPVKDIEVLEAAVTKLVRAVRAPGETNHA